MSKQETYKGRCFCGDVEFSLSGEPEAMAYCHCNSCRRWSAGPVSAFTLWKPDKFQIIKGQDNITSFEKNPETGNETVVSVRKWCKNCGGHLYTEHPVMGLIDVPSAVISKLNFKPGFHVHYQESVLPMSDGLTRFKDLPEEAGGTGEIIAG